MRRKVSVATGSHLNCRNAFSGYPRAAVIATPHEQRGTSGRFSSLSVTARRQCEGQPAEFVGQQIAKWCHAGRDIRSAWASSAWL
jgi:hypothetical protein